MNYTSTEKVYSSCDGFPFLFLVVHLIGNIDKKRPSPEVGKGTCELVLLLVVEEAGAHLGGVWYVIESWRSRGTQ